jgi:hypothetical protein
MDVERQKTKDRSRIENWTLCPFHFKALVCCIIKQVAYSIQFLNEIVLCLTVSQGTEGLLIFIILFYVQRSAGSKSLLQYTQ